MIKTRARSCDGKAKYTKAEAKRAVAQRRIFGRYHSYKCHFCGFFHIGHKPRPRRKR